MVALTLHTVGTSGSLFVWCKLTPTTFKMCSSFSCVCVETVGRHFSYKSCQMQKHVETNVIIELRDCFHDATSVAFSCLTALIKKVKKKRGCEYTFPFSPHPQGSLTFSEVFFSLKNNIIPAGITTTTKNL